MEKVAVAFDVDGTLIHDNEINFETRTLLAWFVAQNWKNVDIIVWSGGGAQYAESKIRLILPSVEDKVKFYSKLEYSTIRKKYDKIIAIDDVQDTRLGDINLIVRNK
jgi:phosphoglycolate phosphatase-like HAD superfamily hydrolase